MVDQACYWSIFWSHVKLYLRIVPYWIENIVLYSDLYISRCKTKTHRKLYMLHK